MKTRTGLLLTQALVLPLCISAAFAQVTELGPADQPQAAQPAPYQNDQGQPEQPQQVFPQQELDQMLAPIALYPDSLLSQILMASTYPIEVVQAARWSRANPGLSGDNAVKAVEQQGWDPSVKSLVAFPHVISMMDEKLDWMERLGDAFLSQQQQVMDTVQQLRQMAQAAGNLQSNENVRVEPVGQTIVIEQANPQFVYVPYYDPTIIYGPWWYPAYPPVFWRPWPGYYARPGFGAGFFWGSGITIGTGFFFGGFDWPHRHVNVVTVNNYYYRAPPPRANFPSDGWYHDPGHRRGVPYRDPVLRREFAHPGPGGRPDGRPDARREFRGNETRMQGPTARPDFRNGPNNRPEQRDNRPDQRDNRPDQRDRAQPRPEGNARPNAPEAARVEPRAVPAQPSVPNVPRPNLPTPNLPSAGNLPRPNIPAPSLPAAPAAQVRPHIFEGVGQGPVVRDSSQRGRDSSQRVAPPVRPVARPQASAPAPRPQAAAPAPRPAPQERERPSGGGGGGGERRGGNEGQQRQH